MRCNSCSRPLAGHPSFPKLAKIFKPAVSMPAQKFFPSPVSTTCSDTSWYICGPSQDVMTAQGVTRRLILTVQCASQYDTTNELINLAVLQQSEQIEAGLTRTVRTPHTRHPWHPALETTATTACQVLANTSTKYIAMANDNLWYLLPHAIIHGVGLLRSRQTHCNMSVLP